MEKELRGWFYKQGPSGLKSWKRRFFSFNESGRCIEYRKQPDDPEVLGFIPLAHIKDVTPSLQAHNKKFINCALSIYTAERTYYLSCESSVRISKVFGPFFQVA
jgi:hypothetical protein